jgi:transcriptional regulator with XRE-family HTH domain
MHYMPLRLKSDAAAKALGSYLRRAREGRRMTRLALAHELSIDQSQISRIERGRMSFVSQNVHKICTFLDVQPSPFAAETSAAHASIHGRLLRLNALLGGQQNGDDAAVNKLLDALEAFAEAYST